MQTQCFNCSAVSDDAFSCDDNFLSSTVDLVDFFILILGFLLDLPSKQIFNLSTYDK